MKKDFKELEYTFKKYKNLDLKKESEEFQKEKILLKNEILNYYNNILSKIESNFEIKFDLENKGLENSNLIIKNNIDNYYTEYKNIALKAYLKNDLLVLIKNKIYHHIKKYRELFKKELECKDLFNCFKDEFEIKIQDKIKTLTMQCITFKTEYKNIKNNEDIKDFFLNKINRHIKEYEKLLKKLQPTINTALLFTGGHCSLDKKDIENLFKIKDYVVCCDSGLDNLIKNSNKSITELKKDIDFIVGDFDSTLYKKEILNGGFEYEIHKRDKDYTDTQLGALHLFEKKTKKIIMCGGEMHPLENTRLDQFISLLNLFRKEASPDIWIAKNFLVIKVKKYLEIKLQEKNQMLGFFSLETKAKVKTSNLKWNFDHLDLNFSSSSNENIDNNIKLEVIKGTVLFVKYGFVFEELLSYLEKNINI